MIEIYTNNQGILNAAQAILLDKDDSKVNPSGYRKEKLNIEFDNIYCLSSDIKFNNLSDRDNHLDEIKAISGVIHQCASGSRIIGYSSEDGVTTKETILRKE